MEATLYGVLEQIRRTYVSHFELMLSSMKNAAQQLLPEAALRDREGAPIVTGPLNTWLRKDVVLVANGAGSPLTIESPTQFQFEPVDFEQLDEGFDLHLRPFSWDRCLASVEAKAGFDLQPLRDWFATYSTADDRPVQPESAKPRGLVHFVSDPSPLKRGFFLEVDFGTAPFGAALDFLSALRDGGATGVALLSPQEFATW